MENIVIPLPKGHSFYLKEDKKDKWKVSYRPVGAHNHYRTKLQALDLFTVLAELPPATTSYFLNFIIQMEMDTNTVRYLPKDIAERSKLGRLYPMLKEAKLVQRVKRGKYLVNPLALPPPPNLFDAVYNQWLSLIEEEEE